ncbi:MAG: hypothetical protein OXF33_09055 [Rhodospirillales bacterium]|nr:hypothetical protein [Rhodospirillales bacterium]
MWIILALLIAPDGSIDVEVMRRDRLFPDHATCELQLPELRRIFASDPEVEVIWCQEIPPRSGYVR